MFPPPPRWILLAYLPRGMATLPLEAERDSIETRRELYRRTRDLLLAMGPDQRRAVTWEVVTPEELRRRTSGRPAPSPNGAPAGAGSTTGATS